MQLDNSQEDIIQEAIDTAKIEGSVYPGMTYEEGLEAVLMVLRGDVAVEEIV